MAALSFDMSIKNTIKKTIRIFAGTNRRNVTDPAG